ncbi:ectonucleoside triphosphate diphosphohydrolase 5-like protein, partial [Dinothrombium tinctorium]
STINIRYEYHSIVFDAGSTGTRIHIFVFELLTQDPLKLGLKSENFLEVKPGLNEYFDEPEKAAESMRPLLQFALQVVPENIRKETGLQFLATAGLRLLKPEQTDAILKSVTKLLSEYPFNVTSISILDGDSEGINAWMTINFLKDSLHLQEGSFGVVDLGGGSTQVTFKVLEENRSLYPKEKIADIHIGCKTETLYTRSYLGYGFRSSRKSILLTDKDVDENEKTIKLSHPCIPLGRIANWTFEGVNYTITGENGDCFDVIRSFVIKKDDNGQKFVEAPQYLDRQPIYAISHYYDHALTYGLLNGDEAVLTVDAYYVRAKAICEEMFATNTNYTSRRESLSNEQKENFLRTYPFACLDLTYVTLLLNQGLGLKLNKTITAAKKIDGKEASWALG